MFQLAAEILAALGVVEGERRQRVDDPIGAMLRPKTVSTPIMPTMMFSGTPYSPAARSSASALRLQNWAPASILSA